LRPVPVSDGIAIALALWLGHPGAVTYLLDTNAVSALMKGDPAVVARLRAVTRADVALPQPVVAEIAYGIELLPRSKRREALADRFELIRGELGRSVWTELRVRDAPPVPENAV
jgi:hypothetical protein